MNKEQKILILQWWEKLQPLVKKFSRENILLGWDREDIMQECFLQLQKALEKYDKDTGISFAYYYKVVLCGWRANENRKNRGKETAYDEVQLSFLKDERVDIENDYERKVINEEVKKYLVQLEEIEKQIIIAYYFENKRLTEIAEMLHISYKTVEYKKKNALMKLRKKLQQAI